MALPAWVIPAIFAAVSTGANAAAQRKVDKANATNAQRLMNRNEEENKKSDLKAADTEKLYQNQNQDIADEGASLGQTFQDAAVDDFALPPPTSGDPNVSDSIIAERDRVRTGTKRFTNERADALGRLRGFDEVMAADGRLAQDNAIDLGQYSANRRGNQRQFDLKSLEAAGAGEEWGTVGDLASIAAMVTGIGAMTAPTAASGGEVVNMGASTFGQGAGAGSSFGLGATAGPNPGLWSKILTANPLSSPKAALGEKVMRGANHAANPLKGVI